MKWVVQPWFDEGEDWPEQPGTPDVIEAETKEAAEAAFPADQYSSIACIDVMTPDEWKLKGDGYPLEGLDA